MTLVDKIVGDSDTASCSASPKSRVTTPSLRSTVNLANPNVYDDPGRRAQRRRLRAAAEGRRQRAHAAGTCGRCRSQGAQTLPPLPLAWTVVTDDPDRPGNPVLWSGNGNNLDAARGHLGRPCRPPTRRCASSPSTAPSSASTTATSSCRPTAARPTPPIAGRQDGRRAARARRSTARPTGFEPHTFDLSAYAGPDRAARLPLRQRRRRQRGRPADRRHHRRRHAGQRRLEPGAVRLADRDPPDRRQQLERAADRHRRAARRRAGSSSSTAATPSRSTGCSWRCCARSRQVVAIVAYDEPTEQVAAVRAVHPDGQRRHPTRRRCCQQLTPTAQWGTRRDPRRVPPYAGPGG